MISRGKPSFRYIEVSIPYYFNQSDFISVNQSINQWVNPASVEFNSQFLLTSNNRLHICQSINQ